MNTDKSESRSQVVKEDVVVRRPFLKDFPTILDISNWATCHTAANFKMEPETLDHWVGLWNGKREMYPWFVAESGGSVVGFAMAMPFSDRCGHVYAAEVSVYVDPDHLGRNVGKALYARLLPTLAAQGYRTVLAAIAIPNAASERLHEAFGFRRVGVLSRIGWKFDRWHDVAFWQLTLRDDGSAPEPIKPVTEAMALGAKED